MNNELLQHLTTPGAVAVMLIWLHTRLNKVESRIEMLAGHMNAPQPDKRKLADKPVAIEETVRLFIVDGLQKALPGVRNAVEFIAELRQATDKAEVAVGRRVVVTGGGNTAIDAAVQSKRLGAERVTLVYRRGAEAMSATDHEQSFAQSEGVHVIHYAQPVELLERSGVLSGVRFEHTRIEGGKLVGCGEFFEVEADVVLKAIGQVMLTDGLSEGGVDLLRLNKGRIAVDTNFATSLAGVYAGGDCVGGKTDLTVQSVADGKQAAVAIHAYLNADREVQHG